MANYETYRNYGVIMPCAIFCFLFIALTILVLAVLCWKKKPVRIFVEMLQLSLPDIDENEDVIGIYEIDITKGFYILAPIAIPAIVATIIFSFWNVWLIEQEMNDVCLPHFDCFPVKGGAVFQGGKLMQQTPIENCAEFETVDDADVSEVRTLSFAMQRELELQEVSCFLQHSSQNCILPSLSV